MANFYEPGLNQGEDLETRSKAHEETVSKWLTETQDD